MLENEMYRPHKINSVLVCVDDFANNEIYGRFYNLYLPKGVRFQGVIDLLSKLESLFDEFAFPQRYNDMRSFMINGKGELVQPTAKKEWRQQMSEEIYEQEAGNTSTFVVEVQYRRNATWQGTVRWIDGNKTERFRSTLELLKLMDSALSEQGEEANCRFE